MFPTPCFNVFDTLSGTDTQHRIIDAPQRASTASGLSTAFGGASGAFYKLLRVLMIMAEHLETSGPMVTTTISPPISFSGKCMAKERYGCG